MRVYEFSKQYNLNNKELLDMLQKAGFEVKSHMSLLPPEAVDFLSKKMQLTKEEESSSREKKIKVQDSQPISPEKKVTKPVEDLSEKKVKVSAPKKISEETPSPRPDSESVVVMRESMVLADLAKTINKSASEIIVTLLKWGILSNKNQMLSEDIVARIAEFYNLKLAKPTQKTEETPLKRQPIQGDNLKKRLPVVVVMGHVDHGKTTLLDYIRNTRVAAREKGGITQHLGAYQAQTKQGDIVFLDTPGHEAFSKMRARGVKVADIAILVVAADDSIMPQTVEAIKHAKGIGIPVVVAINKVDKVDASSIERVRRDLAQYDLLPEEWGGDVVCVPISAKFGTGVDQLLEMIALQTELMELKTDVSGYAKGYILESKLEKGRGVVATILLQQGALNVGDYFIAGTTGGKVNSIIDAYGKQQKSIGPSTPAQIAGFEEMPQVGDLLETLPREEYRKAKSTAHGVKLTTPRALVAHGARNIVVKTDSNSSKEALLEAIAKLSLASEKGFNIVYAGVGYINESDVILASDTNSDIIALHIKAEPNAALLAQKQSVSIQAFDIIYKLLEHLEQVAEQDKEVKMVRKKIGEAVVRRVFDIKNLGVIAGCYVRDGIFSRDGSVVIWRGKQKIGEGPIVSLQREKKSVKEVHAGFECGIMVQDFADWQEDDRIECFTQVPQSPSKK